MVSTSPVVRGTGSALLCGILITLLNGAGLARQAPRPPNFPIAEFRAREQTARWLLRYDWAAWKSSDVVATAPETELKKLGTEWYCTDRGRTWDCFYGRYDAAADRYDVVFHLQSTNGGEFVRVSTTPAPDEATTYARALRTSLAAAPDEVRQAPFRFNSYVRRTTGGLIEVWRLPGGQPDGTLIYGGDLCQTLDATGTKVLATTFAFNGFRAGKANPELELFLSNENDDIATVGNLFFILQFGSQFKTVTVVGRRYLTRLLRTKDGEAWLHAERETKDPRKPLGRLSQNAPTGKRLQPTAPGEIMRRRA